MLLKDAVEAERQYHTPKARGVNVHHQQSQDRLLMRSTILSLYRYITGKVPTSKGTSMKTPKTNSGQKAASIF